MLPQMAKKYKCTRHLAIVGLDRAQTKVLSSSALEREMKASRLLNVTEGAVAEWLRSGLQSRVHRFDSGPRLHHHADPA